MTLRAPRPFLALLSLLVTLVTLCAACGGTGEPVAPDAAGDAAQDAARDAAPVEASADAAEDAPGDAGDAAPDVIAPDAPEPLDAPAVADAREGGADVAQAGDAGADGRADAPGDAREDATADPLAAQVTALSVTARAADYAWTMPVSQSCAVTGGTLSIGTEFRGAEPLTVTASGPLAGPVVLTVVGAGSDVRATVTRGAEYTGGGVRRVNVLVRGMLPTELVMEVTALGCAVR